MITPSKLNLYQSTLCGSKGYNGYPVAFIFPQRPFRCEGRAIHSCPLFNIALLPLEDLLELYLTPGIHGRKIQFPNIGTPAGPLGE